MLDNLLCFPVSPQTQKKIWRGGLGKFRLQIDDANHELNSWMRNKFQKETAASSSAVHPIFSRKTTSQFCHKAEPRVFQNFDSFLRSLGGTCHKTFRGHKHTRHPTKRHVSFGRGSFVKSTRNVLGQKLSTKILFPEKQHGKMKQIWCFMGRPTPSWKVLRTQ